MNSSLQPGIITVVEVHVFFKTIADEKDCKYGTEFELLVFIIATITQRRLPLRINNSAGNFSLSAV
jgi:hypothetical protein